MFKIFGSLFFVGFMAISCGDNEPPRDVDYYTKHFDERRKKVAQCQSEFQEKGLKLEKEGKLVSIDDIKISSNCKNAEQAEKNYIHNLFHQKQDSQDFNPLANFDRSVNYFLENDKEFKEELAACNTGGMLAHTTRCKNVFEAEKIRQTKIKK